MHVQEGASICQVDAQLFLLLGARSQTGFIMSHKKKTFTQIICLLFSLFALASPLFWNCNKVNPAGPEATTLDSTLAIPVSYVSIPIRYDLRRFEAFLNEKISGHFIKQGLRVRNGKDSIYLEIARNAPIKMKIRGQQLLIEFPLHATGTYFRRFVGIEIHNKKHPVETDFRLLLKAEIGLDENWHIQPKIQLSQLQWVQDPVLQFGPIKFNLRKTLEKMLENKKEHFEHVLETQIYEHVSLQKAVQKVWQNLQRPMPIFKKEPEVWFKFGFRKVSGGVRLSEPDVIVCNVLLQAHAGISLDSTQLPRTDSVLPHLQPYPNGIEENDFNISVHTSIPFGYANVTLNRLLQGQKVEHSGYSAAIQNVTIYGSDKGIAMKVRVKGDIKGDLYLTGHLRYYEEDSKLKLDSFDYDVNTENMLVNTATEALRKPLLDFIKPYLEVQVDQYLSQLPGLISQAIEKGKAGETIDLNIDTLRIWNHYGIVTRSDMQVILQTRGSANLELQHLKVKKKLRIRKKPQRHPTQR